MSVLLKLLFLHVKDRGFGSNYYHGPFDSSMSLESYETQPVTMVRSGDWWIQKYIIFSFSPTAVLSH